MYTTFFQLISNRLPVILLLILVTNLISAQDTLIFSNGSVRPIKITSVSQESLTIEYTVNQRTRVISMSALVRYKYEDKWIEVGGTSSVANYPVEIQDRLINRNFLDVRSRWSVGTNISSFLSPEGLGLNHSIRRMITVEPEYRFSNEWLSIKGNLDIGLPFPEVGIFPEFSPQNNAYSTANGIVYYYHYTDENNNVNFDVQRYYYRPNYIDRYIPLQSGLTLKFWPNRKFRERFFLHLGFVVGIADYNAVTIFDSFESTVDEWGYPRVDCVNRIVDVQSNEYFFVRPEAGLGYNFILNKNFSFNIDLAVTHNPKNKGALSDIVYARVDDGEYQKVYEGIDPYPNWGNRFNFSNNVLLRFKLIYHFNKP